MDWKTGTGVFLILLFIGGIVAFAIKPTPPIPYDPPQIMTYDVRYAADSMMLINDWDNCNTFPDMKVDALNPQKIAVPKPPPGIWYVAIKQLTITGEWIPMSNIMRIEG